MPTSQTDDKFDVVRQTTTYMFQEHGIAFQSMDYVKMVFSP